MAIVIAQPCIHTKAAACVPVCPVDVIHPRPDEPGFAEATQLYVDAESCITCRLCIDECPAKAMFEEEDLPAEWRHFTKINADYFQKK